MKIKYSEQGFTLLEVMIVIAVLGILSTIAYPSYTNIVARSQEKVCIANHSQIERGYSAYLVLNNKEHNLIFFELYLQEEYGNRKICPNNGEISYEKGKVYCNLHSMLDDEPDNGEEDDDDNGGVPFI